MKSDMKRKKMFAIGLILSLIIFFAINAVSYWHTKRHIESRVNVEKTLTILYELENLISMIKDAETGERGFIITGNWTYLEPYYNGITAVHKSMKVLKELTPIDDPAYQKLDTIQGMIENRFIEFHKSITLRKERGMEAAIKSVMAAKDEKVMEDIRNLVKELKHESTDLLQRLNRISEVRSHRTLLTIIIGNLVAFLFVLFSLYQLSRDIAERKRAEEVLRESENKYRTLLETTSEGFWLLNPALKTVEVNTALRKMLGYSQDEMLGKTPFDFVDDENRKIFIEQTSKISTTPHRSYEIALKKKNGENIHTYFNATTIRDKSEEALGSFALIMDITGKKIAEEKIKASLKEKEILLSEIHHRVKNNMQVIISLLKLQSDKIEDKKYGDMLKESQNRILSMAHVHEQLYQAADFANIDFGEYVKSVVNGLFVSYGVDTNKVKLNIDIKDVLVDLENAIPCGLIINELVSNSLKHAFPHQGEGNISIALRSTNENDLELTVNDDGVGIPEDLDIRNTESMGLHLVRVLSEQTLEGKMELNRTEGTRFHFLLKRATYKQRI